jgi:hypothetical protein
MQRGWSDADLEKLASGNFVRVFQAVERAQKPGRRLVAQKSII